MGDVVTLRDCQSLQTWKCTFVSAVVRVCPDINPDYADEASDAEFCEGLDPLLAAAQWVEHQGPPPASHAGTRPAWRPFGADADAA